MKTILLTCYPREHDVFLLERWLRDCEGIALAGGGRIGGVTEVVLAVAVEGESCAT